MIKEETYYFPAIAGGLRDLAGTGEFSSEYLVSSKKIGSLDLSIGIGWGVLGTDNNISNPFTTLHESFRNRDSESGQGGALSYRSWFSGNTAIFGGLEYDLPKRGLRLKLEYDTSNPDSRGVVR